MGNLQAIEMAAWSKDRQQALTWHLQHNHYPPVGEEFVPVAEKAIDLVNAGKPDSHVQLPNYKTLAAADIVSGLHLEPWLEHEDNDR